MPTEAKLGLVFGIGLTILLAIYTKPKEVSGIPVQPTVSIEHGNVAPGQATSLRK